MALEFTGTSSALSQPGIDQACAALGVQPPHIWAVMSVETTGCGFLANRRPQIRYERHIFHRLTGGRFDDGDISDPSSGGYGPGGAPQYDRLARAIALDRAAALKATSWGLGQIMGENAVAAGYSNVEDMVTAMCESEDLQLAALASFVKSVRLDRAMQNLDWVTFARGYNGPGYAANQYDKKLDANYKQFLNGLPSLDVRAAQLYLTFNGFDVGGVDGVMGKKTRAALTAFQTVNGLTVSAEADADTLARLSALVQAGTGGAAA